LNEGLIKLGTMEHESMESFLGLKNLTRIVRVSKLVKDTRNR